MINQQQQTLKKVRTKVRESLFPKKIEPQSSDSPSTSILTLSPAKSRSKFKGNGSSKYMQSYSEQKFEDVYQTEGTIGQGAHGIVKVCTRKLKSIDYAANFGLIPSKYAVKKIYRAGDPEIINTIIETFGINRSLNDIPKVVQAYDLFVDETQELAFWVMEQCEYKSLQSQLKKPMSHDQIQQVIKELSDVIYLLHQRGICHRDIKPDNILVSFGSNNNTSIKLIDFGVSKRFHIQKKNPRSNIVDMWTRTGSILYQAPEVFQGGGYDEKIDIWAVGVILYQLLCGKFPYFCETNLDTIELITDPNTSFVQNEEFQNLSYLQQDIIKRLLNKDPTKRLSAYEFTLHPWLHQTSNHQIKAVDDIAVGSVSQQNNSTGLSSSSHLGSNQIQVQLPSIFNDWEDLDWSSHIHYIQREWINNYSQRVRDIALAKTDKSEHELLHLKSTFNNHQQVRPNKFMNLSDCASSLTDISPYGERVIIDQKLFENEGTSFQFDQDNH